MVVPDYGDGDTVFIHKLQLLLSIPILCVVIEVPAFSESSQNF